MGASSKTALDLVERWSGPLLLVGGALVIIASTLHPQGTASQFLLQPLWVPVHILEFFAFMSILLGLVGWYSRFSTKLGKLGTLGFLISFFGTATGAPYALWSEALLRPYVAANAPMLEDRLLTNSSYIAAFLITLMSVFVGYLIFSIATVRAKVLPKWGRWLVVILVIGFLSIFGVSIAYVSALVFEALIGLSIAGWGYAIVSTPKAN